MILLYTSLVTFLVGFLALASLGLSDTLAKRVHGGSMVERAAASGEAGLAFFAEQWRRTVAIDRADGIVGDDDTFLDYDDLDGDGIATTAGEHAQIGVRYPLGTGSSFELLAVRDLDVGSGVRGKMITVRGWYEEVPFVWRSLIAPNLTAPIQGVGTQQGQTWRSGSHFSAIHDGTGTVFGNGNLTVTGNHVIEGDVRMGGTVTASGTQPITGTIEQRASRINFPDQQQVINDVTNVANDPKPSGYWKNPVTSLVVEQALTGAEAINADASRLGSGWSNTNTPNMKHMFLRGGKASLPAGNYAFGRLWLDGTILTIKAPPGGGTLVLPDLYLTNGARLILDTRDGPFTVVSPKNNVFETGSAVGSTGAVRWNGSSWVSGSPSLKIDGTSSENIWNKTAGEDSSGSGGPKPDRGSTTGYDDWSIRGGSTLAVITPDPNAKGFELYMASAVDFVLADGGRVMGGVQESDLPALQNRSTTWDAIGNIAQHAMGFLAWSGGAELPRLNMSTGYGESGRGTSFTGLCYGAFEATLGANAEFTGAFVGKWLDTNGEVRYDARLAKLLTTEDPDTHHVVVKFREGGR